MLPTIFVIPDTQIKPGVPMNHMTWIGRYIAEKGKFNPNAVIVHLGDHWDMPSLSSYDKKGGTKMEGRRYTSDVAAGNQAFVLLDKPISRVHRWSPRKVILRGNHEDRITRAAQDNAQIDGAVSLDHLETLDWEVIPYLVPVTIHGISFAHFFYNPMTGRPYSGMIETRIKNIGTSFVQGHQQDFKYGELSYPSGRRIGLISGNCTLHDEDYLGPQGNRAWRGILVLHEAQNGEYDLMKVSLDFLCRKYEGISLKEKFPELGTGEGRAVYTEG